MKQKRLYLGLLGRLHRQVRFLESLQLEQYLLYVTDTRRFLWRSFMGGVARGLGNAVGFTLLGAVVVVVISRITVENVPLIGDFLADIVEIVQKNIGAK